MLARARAWRAFDVSSVMNAPLQVALTSCWPWSDAEYGVRLRADWRGAVEQALARSEVTLAVAPLHILAEPHGLLDTLQAQGFEIEGPAWKN